MQTHGDRVHYLVHGLGDWDRDDCKWLANDSKLTVDVDTLPCRSDQPIPEDWRQSASARSPRLRFRSALRPRSLCTGLDLVNDRSYPFDIPPDALVRPRFPAGVMADGQFRFLNVDGGLINNNPFDYAEYALLDRPAARPLVHPQTTNAAVIMVAPFPDPPAFLPEGQPRAELVSLLRALLPTLTTQARFRPYELAQAMDPHNYGRYLIAPRRMLPGAVKEERFAIASGLLAGFGGFLDEAFRAHDYQLGPSQLSAFPGRDLRASGRRGAHRCKQRLSPHSGGRKQRNASSVADHTALRNRLRGSRTAGLAAHRSATLRHADRSHFRTSGEGCPDPSRLAGAQQMARSGRTGRALVRPAADRPDDTMDHSVGPDTPRSDRGVDHPRVAPRMGGDIGPDNVREVLAELAAPDFDYATVGGIAKSAHLPPAAVGLHRGVPEADPTLEHQGRRGAVRRAADHTRSPETHAGLRQARPLCQTRPARPVLI